VSGDGSIQSRPLAHPSGPPFAPAGLLRRALGIGFAESLPGAPTPVPLFTRDRLLPPILAGLVIWGIAAGRTVASALAHGDPLALAAMLLLPPLLYWLALLPVILWLGLRVPVRRGSWLRSIPAHAAAATVVSALYAEVLVRLMSRWLPDPIPPWAGNAADWGIRFQFGLLSYGFILSWGYVHEYFTALREREVAMTKLETELAQAQLRVLKAQLQPHFLFNTLHAITVLIRHDPEAAGRMVVQLSDLLRMALLDSERPEVTLDQELRFLRLYLEIEQTRFRDRLEVRWDIAPALEDAAVPTLLLQPLVENALKHGVGTRAAGGRVVIAASTSDGMLTLRVADNGPGFRNGEIYAGAGIGIPSTRGRLEALYGAAHRFDLERNHEGGTSVTVGIPYRRLEAAARGG
jgi:two-component system, LytTR family, sensor kinase